MICQNVWNNFINVFFVKISRNIVLIYRFIILQEPAEEGRTAEPTNSRDGRTSSKAYSTASGFGYAEGDIEALLLTDWLSD